VRLARFRAPDGAVRTGSLDGDEIFADGERFAIAGVRLLSPVGEPPSIRDFYAFEAHVRTARAKRGLEMDPDWYKLPVFYFTNPATIYGPDDEIPYPSSTQALDYELEFAWVMGRDLVNASREEALGAIAGFTIFNDFSARDVQRREMKLSLGPSKGKDFASAFGPFLLTPDEFRLQGAMVARVNGVEYSRGDLSDLYHDIGDMIAHASRDSRVRAGDVMGSGTVGTGCILELGDRPWLQPGDVVELEVHGLGTLRNTVGPRL
jgi:fumarylacetoacetate (FAA) hydrolase